MSITGSVAATSPRVLPRPMAFWLVAGMLALLLFAAGAPSPLYAVYAARWRCSATTLTAVFAVYAIALLAAFWFWARCPITSAAVR